MLGFLGSVLNWLIVLFFFSFTVFVHELGHFLVARRLGFKVLEFSIGFGPALWKKFINGVLWKFAIIPLGGYVKLPQMDPTGSSLTADEKKAPLPVMEPWKRIAVGVAGVTCNMILAIVLAWIVFAVGRPAERRDYPARVAFVETNGVLYAGGLRVGDEIVAVNDSRVSNWDDAITEAALGHFVTLHVARATGMAGIKFNADTAQGAAEIFVREVEPQMPVIIGPVDTNWPAWAAGLRPGDRMISIDGKQLVGIEHMVSIVAKSEGRTMNFLCERAGKQLNLAITPRYDEKMKRFRIGHGFDAEIIHPKPLSEIRYAAGAVFRLLHKLTAPSTSGRAFEAIGGAPEIFYIFWHMAKTGLIMAISFAVTINVNLAILNLLPFMVLDGGHICLALWEWIRRKPASPKFVAALWQAGAVCLIGLMLFLTLRGFYRINKWTRAPDDTNAPAAATSPTPSQPAPEKPDAPAATPAPAAP